MAKPDMRPARNQSAGPRRPRPATAAPPFTSETARQAALKGVAKRREAAANREAAERAMYELVGERLMKLPPREAIPGMAEIVVMETLKAFVLEDVKPKTVDEHLRVLRAMTAIAQIDVTELPSDSENTKEARLSALAALREQAAVVQERAAQGVRAIEHLADEGVA